MEASKNLFGFEQIKADTKIGSIMLFEKIRKEVEEYVLEQSDNADSTDGVLDFLTTLSEKIQEEFYKILDGNSNKKRFLRELRRVFALILNTKVDTPEKNKNILKTEIENSIRIWPGQKRP